MVFGDGVAAGGGGWEVQYLFLDVRGEGEQIHDLGDAGAGYVAMCTQEGHSWTLLNHIEFDIRIQPLHGTLIGAQGVVDLMAFLLRRSYANPSHAGVKDVLVLRTETLHSMARRSMRAQPQLRA